MHPLLAVLTLTAAGYLLAGCQSTPEPAITRKAEDDAVRYLLLDSRILEEKQNARLAVGTVRKHAANR